MTIRTLKQPPSGEFWIYLFVLFILFCIFVDL